MPTRPVRALRRARARANGPRADAMSAARRRAMLLWVAMPLLLGACGFGLSRGARALAWFPDASKGVSDPGESALAAALEDVVWRHGSAQDIRAVLGASLRLQ